MDNAYYCRLAIELKLVKTSTEFWTLVKTSGLTPREWVVKTKSSLPNWDNLSQPGWEKFPDR